MPVVLTPQIAVGTVLIGDFAGSVAAYVREGLRIETANQGSTQFVSNTSLVRAEERLLLTVPRPTGLLKLSNINSMAGHCVAQNPQVHHNGVTHVGAEKLPDDVDKATLARWLAAGWVTEVTATSRKASRRTAKRP